MLAIVGAILIPIGLLFFVAAPLSIEITRPQGPMRPPRPPQVVLAVSLAAVGAVIEITALVFCLVWLYQAWRLILRGDEEYSAGLIVGLLFVPFFNLYWIFRAIPGLSTAIQDEMKYQAPSRAHSAGWIPGLAACILALIPYLQPVAVCMFVAWMLIANNALQRFVRFHEALADEPREGR